MLNVKHYLVPLLKFISLPFDKILKDVFGHLWTSLSRQTALTFDNKPVSNFKTSHERYFYAKKTFWHFGEMLNWDKLLCTFMRTYLSKSSLEWDWIYQILRLIISDNHDFWRRLQACACIRISFFVSLIWSNPTPYQSRQPWLLKATWSSLYFQIGIDVNTPHFCISRCRCLFSQHLT